MSSVGFGINDNAVAQWRALAEFAPDASMLVAADGRILALNSKAALVFGYQVEELRSKLFRELLARHPHEYDYGSFEDFLGSTRSNSDASRPVLIGLGKEGEMFPIELGCSRFDPGGSQLFWVTVRDISTEREGEQLQLMRTDRLQQLVSERTDQLGERAEQLEATKLELESAHKRLREQAAILRLVLDSLSEGVIVIGTDGLLRMFNPASKIITGVGPTDVPEGEWASFYKLYRADGVTPLSPDEVPMAEVLRTGKEVRREVVVRNPDLFGDKLLDVVGRPLRDATGNLIAGVVVFRDITEERRAQQQLTESAEKLEVEVKARTEALASTAGALELEMEERRLAQVAREAGQARMMTLADSLPALIAYINCDLRYEFGNRRYEEWFGISPAELLGLSLTEIPGKPFEMIQPAVEKVLRGEAVTLDTKITHKTLGQRDVNITYVPDEREGEILGFHALIHDVTDRIRAERQAERNQRDLAHVTRVTMLGEFATGIAHELGQPLTSISSNAQAGIHLLASEEIDAAEMKEILDDVVLDGRRAAEIVRRLRSLVKRDADSLDSTDLNGLVESALRLAMGRITDSGIVLQLDLAPSLPEVVVDTVQMQQVILNLISNSIDAIGAVRKGDDVGTVLVSTEVEENSVVLSVHDNGIGIRPEEAKAIFERFYTTKSEGLGMGLAISKSIIQSFGGWISARAGDQSGLIVEVRLPTAN